MLEHQLHFHLSAGIEFIIFAMQLNCLWECNQNRMVVQINVVARADITAPVEIISENPNRIPRFASLFQVVQAISWGQL